MSQLDAGVQVTGGEAAPLRMVEPAVPPAAAAATTPVDVPSRNASGNETHAVVVNGKEQHMTLSQLVKAAEKVGGADERFRQAADGVKVMNIYNRMNEGVSTYEEREEYCNLFKLEGEQRQGILDLTNDADAGEGGTSSEGTSLSSPGQSEGEALPQLIKLEDCDPHLRSLLERADRTTVAKENEDFDSQAAEQINKDELAKKMLANMEPARREGAESALLEMVRAEIVGRLQGGAKYGPVLLKDAVTRVASRVERIGVQTQKPDNPIPGLSPMDNSMAAVVKSEDSIERVSSTDPRYADNVAARVIRKAMTLVGK